MSSIFALGRLSAAQRIAWALAQSEDALAEYSEVTQENMIPTEEEFMVRRDDESRQVYRARLRTYEKIKRKHG